MTPVALGARNRAPDLLDPSVLATAPRCLPAATRTALSEHLVRPRHQRDLDQGAGWVELLRGTGSISIGIPRFLPERGSS